MEIKYEIQELMLHKKDKLLIQVDLRLIDGNPTIAVYHTDNGISTGSQILDASFLNSLPKLTGDFLVDLNAVLRHFKMHGFKTVTTITQTSKSIKFG